MAWAVDEHGNAVRLAPETRAICSGCGGVLRAHCGDILIDHWHHESGKDCDPWHETETEWHQQWKAHFPEECREFVRKPHRADAVNYHGMFFEFQHSSIAPAEIHERETFWGNLIWVFDARDWFKNFNIRIGPDKITFKWKHARLSLFEAKRPRYLDTGTEMFRIAKLYDGGGGVGEFIPYPYFKRFLLTANPKA